MSGGRDVAEAFKADIANHKMTILRDDGLYRHLRFIRWVTTKDGKQSSTSAYWFDLVTWPGALAINGDMGSYMFSRTEDMFGFFRPQLGDNPNPGYWAEKIRAGGDVRQYSEDRFKRLVVSDAEEGEAEFPGLMEAVQAEILSNGDIHFEQGARQLVEQFKFGDTFKGACRSCGAAVEGLTEAAAHSWASGHRAQTGHLVYPGPIEGFRFYDTWEWDLADWSYRYLWCCHAIQWGIARYDEARKAVAA